MCLSMPLKVHELIQTVETMSYTITRMRKKRRTEPKVRSEEEKRMLQDAKELLMVRNNMSEEEAHRYIQKRSMDNGTGLIETAQMILSLMHGKAHNISNFMFITDIRRSNKKHLKCSRNIFMQFCIHHVHKSWTADQYTSI